LKYYKFYNLLKKIDSEPTSLRLYSLDLLNILLFQTVESDPSKFSFYALLQSSPTPGNILLQLSQYGLGKGFAKGCRVSRKSTSRMGRFEQEKISQARINQLLSEFHMQVDSTFLIAKRLHHEIDISSDFFSKQYPLVS
jgi:hypothetical protein